MSKKFTPSHHPPIDLKGTSNTTLFQGIIRGMLPMYLLMLLTEKPYYGTEIMQILSHMSGGIWKPSPGSVYPILKRFEEEGLVTFSFQSGNAAARKVYTITKKGKSRLPEVQKSIVEDLKTAKGIIEQHIDSLENMLLATGGVTSG